MMVNTGGNGGDGRNYDDVSSDSDCEDGDGSGGINELVKVGRRST